jgi:quercetin dioxygenase-like cupin family protein
MTSNLTRRAVEQSWRERGFSCASWVDPPGRIWADFVHPTDELVLVVRGEVEFEFAGAVHHPGLGQELLIPAGARHTVRNVGSAESEWLYGYKRARV